MPLWYLQRRGSPHWGANVCVLQQPLRPVGHGRERPPGHERDRRPSPQPQPQLRCRRSPPPRPWRPGKIVALYHKEPWGEWDQTKRDAYTLDFMAWYDKDATPDGNLDRGELKTFVVTQAPTASPP